MQSQAKSHLEMCFKVQEKLEKAEYLDPLKAEEHREKGNELFKANNMAAAKQDLAFLACFRSLEEYDEAIRRNPTPLAGCRWCLDGSGMLDSTRIERRRSRRRCDVPETPRFASSWPIRTPYGTWTSASGSSPAL